jgi:hypothetical protein
MGAEMLLHDTLASAVWDILYLPRVSLKERKKVLACAPPAPFEFPQFFPCLILQHSSKGSANMLVLQTEPARVREVENATTLASAHEDVEGLVRKVILLRGELVEVRQAWEVVKEKFCSLSDVSADGLQWLVVSEKEHQEHFEELSFLWAWGSELCLAFPGPPRVRNYLLEGMQAAALHHVEVVEALTTLRAAVSSVVELVLERSPDESFWVEVMDELVAKF